MSRITFALAASAIAGAGLFLLLPRIPAATAATIPTSTAHVSSVPLGTSKRERMARIVAEQAAITAEAAALRRMARKEATRETASR